MSDQLLIVRREMPAPVAHVFDALTKPELIAKWFFAGPDWSARIETTAESGAPYLLEMIEPGGAVTKIWGEFREIDPPKRLVFTWNSEIAEDTVVTIELTPGKNDTTTLVLYHALPEILQPVHTAGWNGCLENLLRYLRTKVVADN